MQKPVKPISIRFLADERAYLDMRVAHPLAQHLVHDPARIRGPVDVFI